MTEVECTAKKWGGSIGIVLPKDVVEREHIKPNEKICVIVRRRPTAKEMLRLVGPLQRKESTAKAMKEIREGWD
jgi:antitoxin component of MazEF toxin-antitoxin module